MQANQPAITPPTDMHATGTTYGGSAPGRMDVMGGIADYSGARVLQMPLQRKTQVQVTLRRDGLYRLASNLSDTQALYDELSLSDVSKGEILDPELLKAYLNAIPGRMWMGYVLGGFALLHRSRGVQLKGADITVRSDVPPGKGVSSSAALEVATLKALCLAYQIELPGTELARMAQEVENTIVGAPCGLMDQLASRHGREGHLLPITCRPDLLGEPIALPEGVHFVGLDSGVRHAVTGADYGQVRTAAFMGYTVVAQSLGVDAPRVKAARLHGSRSDLPYQGYLAAIKPSEWMQRFEKLVPQRLTGGEFMAKYGETIDPLSVIRPDVSYHLRACARHPVMENHRVELFEQLLAALPESKAERTRALKTLGELMYQSHEAYNLCGLGHERTDELVALVREDSSGHLHGAKITGGGSGGTVCVLVQGEEGLSALEDVREKYRLKTGYNAEVIR